MTELSIAALLEELHTQQLEIRMDSRRVERGDVFVAMRGATHDAAAFIPQALEAGASVIVCGADGAGRVGGSAARMVVYDGDVREALWRMAQARMRTDDPPFPVIGVTGTNGKTTTAFLLEHLFTSVGMKCGMLGTVDYRWPGFRRPAPLTTPDSMELHRMLDAMRQAGGEAAGMETSSHAIVQQRVGGVRFAGAIFTNLTQDHLDYHADMESYYAAKARLFLEMPASDKACAVNGDDPYGRRLLQACKTAVGYGLSGSGAYRPHLAGKILSSGRNGLHLEMHFGDERWELRSPLVGAFNALNLLGVQALWLCMGLPFDALKRLESFPGVPGRLERIENPQGLHVFVDYAHTPDALVNVLQALRVAGFERVIAVFGCGGDRDRAKRPLMGAAAAKYADVAVLTSDNPRKEDPLAIMDDVLPGLKGARRLVREPDRREATRRALELLGPKDALLVAGKGHEDYQIIGEKRHPYSDQHVIRELLKCA
ncbi:MAG: UDP-N-acetylmuramoyl-L-alanyl-D-glutamate--2,6-diaminopimelate ligase [Deltaproteobacteria bacterium]|jgi:UDP-N-acetylmuramoyl-L-alanyl-D-glutamate--2,6-diaminopimelate ligase|nr:UDP-N-acetylmuramoyl-L-alanyl-D-glutamate--2,6-diaminopimelate ligase [Deltaproteobacteria bacterium]